MNRLASDSWQSVEEELHSQGLRLIDATPEAMRKINARLQPRPELGQLLPSVYQLLKQDLVDLDKVRVIGKHLHAVRFPGFDPAVTAFLPSHLRAPGATDYPNLLALQLAEVLASGVDDAFRRLREENYDNSRPSERKKDEEEKAYHSEPASRTAEKRRAAEQGAEGTEEDLARRRDPHVRTERHANPDGSVDEITYVQREDGDWVEQSREHLGEKAA